MGCRKLWREPKRDLGVYKSPNGSFVVRGLALVPCSILWPPFNIGSRILTMTMEVMMMMTMMLMVMIMMMMIDYLHISNLKVRCVYRPND